MTETEWWQSLTGNDIDANTAGVPPYDVVRVAELVVDKLGVREGPVLDFGCGTGRLTEAIHARAAGLDLMGVEIAANIRARFTDRLSVPVYDTVPDQWLVGAYSITVFQHLPHDECAAAVQAIARRLVNGARFVFQYVEGDEDAFCSHQAHPEDASSWCTAAGLEPETMRRDDQYEQWQWVVAVKPPNGGRWDA